MIRLFKHYISRALLTLLLAEMLYLFLAVYFGQALNGLWFGQESWPMLGDVASGAVAFVLVMTTIMIAMGLYERNLWNGRADMLLRVGISFLFGLFAMSLVYYLLPEIALSRGEFSLVFGIAFVGVLLLRFGFFKASDHALLKRRVLVLGVGQNAARLEELQQRSNAGFVIPGYIQVHEDEEPGVPPTRMRQVTGSLLDLANELQIDEIVVAMDDRRKGFPVEEMLDCRIDGISISPFLAFFERETGKIQLDALRPSNMIFEEGFQKALVNRVLKRLFDLLASLLLLAVAWPFMAFATLAIWIESGGRGPILYRQTRIGRNNELFELIKFRSMSVDAERDGVARWAQAGDSRITRVGGILRETRIDELPQLFNVLWGHMSFVGPRPERPQFVAELSKNIPFYTMRHMVNPGITGWAQICYPYGATEEDAREKLQYDLYYIKNYSVFFDVIILLQTVHTILWGKGAH
jgi:sugar transferase (PEP-CTERM system associated)